MTGRDVIDLPGALFLAGITISDFSLPAGFSEPRSQVPGLVFAKVVDPVNLPADNGGRLGTRSWVPGRIVTNELSARHGQEQFSRSGPRTD